MTADRSLVHSMKRRCEYTDQDLQVQAQAGSTSTSSDVLLEQSSTNDFPVALFLDPQVFKQFNIELRAPRLPIPQGVAEVIEDANRIHEISSSYFKTVHPWFPVISRTKFYGNLLNRASYQDCDLALLVLCMRLILHQPSNSGTRTHSRLYVEAKKYVVDLELSGLLAMSLIQASLLIALYEIAHGIYPAAYVTVGACARYGVALGLDKKGSQWDHTPLRWIGYE
jgi:hypothetical protein